jgi:hypothetical protein
MIVSASNTNGLFQADEDPPISVIDLWRFLRDVPQNEQQSLLESAAPLTDYGTLGPAETMCVLVAHFTMTTFAQPLAGRWPIADQLLLNNVFHLFFNCMPMHATTPG